MLSMVKKIIKNRWNVLLLKYGNRPKVLSIDETLDYMLENRCSVSRYGDGEFNIIMGHQIYFQKKDSGLAHRLKEILHSEIDNHIVCLADMFDYDRYYTQKSKEYSEKWLSSNRKQYLHLIDTKKYYYNANITRPYMIYSDKSRVYDQMEKWKKLWSGKDVLIIEGEKTRFGVGNDLLLSAASIKRILCPSNNAYNKYSEILSAALEYGKGKIILLALGPAATVLAYDIAKSGGGYNCH